MKTENLTGPLLDLWAALALGWKVANEPARLVRKGEAVRTCGNASNALLSEGWSPSTIWAHGGPVFEAEDIDVNSNPARAPHVKYHAIGDAKFKVQGLTHRMSSYGPTELIARTRCLVACAFGEEVPGTIPQEYFYQGEPLSEESLWLTPELSAAVHRIATSFGFRAPHAPVKGTDNGLSVFWHLFDDDGAHRGNFYIRCAKIGGDWTGDISVTQKYGTPREQRTIIEGPNGLTRVAAIEKTLQGVYAWADSLDSTVAAT
jgi:hypothetical protein